MEERLIMTSSRAFRWHSCSRRPLIWARGKIDQPIEPSPATDPSAGKYSALTRAQIRDPGVLERESCATRHRLARQGRKIAANPLNQLSPSIPREEHLGADHSGSAAGRSVGIRMRGRASRPQGTTRPRSALLIATSLSEPFSSATAHGDHTQGWEHLRRARPHLIPGTSSTFKLKSGTALVKAQPQRCVCAVAESP